MRTMAEVYSNTIEAVCDANANCWESLGGMMEMWYYINSPAGDTDAETPFFYDIQNWIK